MGEQQPFRLLDLRIEPDTGQVTGSGRSLRLEPKPMAVLLTLARTPGAVVTRQQLLDSVWPGVVVGDEAVTRCISELRDALGDDRQTPRFIRTLPKRGYVLLATPEPEAGLPATSGVPARDADGGITAPTLPTRTPALPAPSDPPGPSAAALLAFALTLLCVLGVFGWRFWPLVQDADAPVTGGRTIAVLPFAEPGAANSYFGDGLAEQIVNALVQVPELRVAATGITFPLVHAPGGAAAPGSVKDAAALGRQMQVDVVLTGSIQRQRDRLRVNVQLIDSRAGTHLWSARYDRQAADVFEVQDDIANRVAQALRIELATPLRVARVSQDLGAYDLYRASRSSRS